MDYLSCLFKNGLVIPPNVIDVLEELQVQSGVTITIN